MTELFPPSVTQRQGKMTLFQALPQAPGAHGGENPPILIQRGFGQRLEGAPGSELPWTCSLRLPSTPGEAAQTASSNSAILTAHPIPTPPKLQGHYPRVWWFQLAFAGTCPDFTGRAEGREGALGSDKHLFANKQAVKVGSASPPPWCYRCPRRCLEVLPRSLGNREVSPWVTPQRLWHS